MLESAFSALGKWAVRRRWAVLGAWLVILAIAMVGAQRLPDLLREGGDAPPGSPSDRVNSLVADRFDSPFAQTLILTARSDRDLATDPTFAAFLAQVRSSLKSASEVAQVLGPAELSPLGLVSHDDQSTFLLLGLKTRRFDEAKGTVRPLRERLAPLIAAERRVDPTFEAAVTGVPAIDSDVGLESSKSSSEAEARALPIILVVLFLAFGSLVASGVPFFLGLVATTTAIGAVFLLALHMPLSPYVQNIATMMGLGVGIDYSLLVVNRFREELQREPSAEAAMAATMRSAGLAVATSGLTVLIGLGGLLIPGDVQSTSIGLGGIAVLAVALSLSLTLLPSLLAILRPYLDSPRRFRLPPSERANRLWEAWARGVMRHRVWAIALSALVLLAIAYPATTLRLGLPDGHWMPPELESERGFVHLDRMGISSALTPIYVVARTRDGSSILSPQAVESLFKLSGTLKADPRVAQVLGPVDLQPHMPQVAYRMLYQDPAQALKRYPTIATYFLERDRKAALMLVFAKQGVPLSAIKDMTRQDRAMQAPSGLEVLVGGPAAMALDLDILLKRTFPLVVAFIIVVTFLLLFATFRSVLIPLKAIAMNLLSVGASFGVLTWVFQEGHFRRVIGLAAPTHNIVPMLPVLIFCLVFGLSMDYEVFLVSRISEVFRDGADPDDAIAKGLGSTGRLVTSAALVMVAVFGAFAFSRIVIVQMLGLGLAAAVLFDATLIRALLVPAIMTVAGRWNWWPGSRSGEGSRASDV